MSATAIRRLASTPGRPPATGMTIRRPPSRISKVADPAPDSARHPVAGDSQTASSMSLPDPEPNPMPEPGPEAAARAGVTRAALSGSSPMTVRGSPAVVRAAISITGLTATSPGRRAMRG